MTKMTFAEHAERTKRELERYRPDSPRWEAARLLALAAANLRPSPNRDHPT